MCLNDNDDEKFDRTDLESGWTKDCDPLAQVAIEKREREIKSELGELEERGHKKRK